MDNQQSPYYSPNATGIEDLPVGLLGRSILQHLPWEKRVQVEGVCRRWQREAIAQGWDDVKQLKWGNESDKISWLQLLSRAGPHLTTLDLQRNSGLNEGELLVGLVKCTKLRHLSVRWGQVTYPTLFYVCDVYTSTLKSLRICALGRCRSTSAKTVYEGLHRLPALEYLRLDWMEKVEIHLPALLNLRHLALNYCEVSKGSFEGLATLPSLRSLNIILRAEDVNDLSALQRFPHLEDLRIKLFSSNTSSFIEALPHLGVRLKALEIVGGSYLCVKELKQLVSSIAAYLPLLEHLNLSVPVPAGEVEEVKRQLGTFTTFPQLKSLRSLCLWSAMHQAMEQAAWGWLERICQEHHQQLEYLELYSAPPFATLCSILEMCKRLSGMKFTSSPCWNADDLAKLAEAVSSIDAKNDGDEEGERLKREPPPTLRIAFDNGDAEIRMAKITNSSIRLQFTSLDEMWSQTLHQHRYGCLSEGQPAFDAFDDDP